MQFKFQHDAPLDVILTLKTIKFIESVWRMNGERSLESRQKSERSGKDYQYQQFICGSLKSYWLKKVFNVVS